MIGGAATERVAVSQIIDLAIDEAFDAWLDPAVIPLWWGPEGYHTSVKALDAVVGGHFRFQMTAPSGSSCPMTGTYMRIDRPTALEFEVHDHCVADIPASVEPPTQSSRVEVRFEGFAGKTRITISQAGLTSTYQVLAQTGWGDSLARFKRAAHMQGESQHISTENEK